MDHNSKIEATMVLAYIQDQMHEGVEAEDVAGFAQDMANMVDNRMTYREAGMEGYASFVEWVEEQL